MKFTHYLLSVLLIGVHVYSMELAPLLPAQKIYKINTYQDIPCIPLQNICNSFLVLPKKQQKKIERRLSQSLLFNLGMLPQEIRSLIVDIMTEGDRFAAKKFAMQPVLMSFKIYDEIKKHEAYVNGV